MSIGEKKRTFWSVLRANFGRGLVLVIPIVITWWILNFLFAAIDGTISPVFDRVLGRHVPGLGFIAMIALILLLGILSKNLIGRYLMAGIEGVIGRLPLARTIYGSMKDMMTSFSPSSKGRSFKDVVLVEYPRKGLATIGFATNRITIEKAEPASEMVSVYIPNPPNPTSGLLILVPRESVQVLDMSVEQGLKLVLSGGIVTTGTLTVKERGESGSNES
ncbi:MAG TPA: DUF502 domain-containing protein [Bacteroidota bacterium]|nr:DUF502 domain-containing protein [Bacteroidota bacterium]